MIEELLDKLKEHNLSIQFVNKKWTVSIKRRYVQTASNSDLLAALLQIVGKVMNE